MTQTMLPVESLFTAILASLLMMVVPYRLAVKEEMCAGSALLDGFARCARFKTADNTWPRPRNRELPTK
jgi:hypothetical protein